MSIFEREARKLIKLNRIEIINFRTTCLKNLYTKIYDLNLKKSFEIVTIKCKSAAKARLML